MRIDPFKLERYFAQHEFTTPFMLSCSDCDGLDLNELLAQPYGGGPAHPARPPRTTKT